MSDPFQTPSSLEDRINALTRDIEALQSALATLQVEKRNKDSCAFISANGIKRVDVEFSDFQTTGQWFETIAGFAK